MGNCSFAFSIINATLVDVYSCYIIDRRRVYPASLLSPILSLSELYLDSYSPGDRKRHGTKHQCIFFLGKTNTVENKPRKHYRILVGFWWGFFSDMQ